MMTSRLPRVITAELNASPELLLRYTVRILLLALLSGLIPGRAIGVPTLLPKVEIEDTLTDSIEALRAGNQLPLEIPATRRVTSSANDPGLDWKSADLRNSIEITQQDVARGFIEVPFASRLTVRANDRSDFHVVVALRADWIRGAEILGIGRRLRIGPQGGVYREMVPASGRRTFHLSYRIDLTQDATPGTFPWPISVSARGFASSIASSMASTVRSESSRPSRLTGVDLQQPNYVRRELRPSRQHSDLLHRAVRASSR